VTLAAVIGAIVPCATFAISFVFSQIGGEFGLWAEYYFVYVKFLIDPSKVPLIAAGGLRLLSPEFMILFVMSVITNVLVYVFIGLLMWAGFRWHRGVLILPALLIVGYWAWIYTYWLGVLA
jgi:hypothetical protein